MALQTPSDAAFSRQRRRFIVGYMITILGTGFVYPLTALYLNRILGLRPGAVAGYFAVVAISGLVLSPLAGTLSDSRGPFPVAAAGLVLQVLGPLVLALAEGAALAMLGGLLLGAGNGVFFAVQTPVFVALFGKDRVSRMFALQYLLMNIAVAVAGAFSGVVVAQAGEVGFRVAFLLNGLSFGVYGLALARMRKTTSSRSTDEARDEVEEAAAKGGGLRNAAAPYRDLRFLPLILLQLALTAFGFAQMDAVLPLVLTDNRAFSLASIGFFLSLNGVAVVAFQTRGAKIAESLGHVGSLTVTVFAWLAAYAIGWFAWALSGPNVLKIALLMGFAVVFAVGEVFLSPSLQPLVVERAPERSLGSYSSSMSLTYSLGLVTGPMLGLPIFGAVGGGGYWLVPLLGILAATVILLVIRRQSRPVLLEPRPVT